MIKVASLHTRDLAAVAALFAEATATAPYRWTLSPQAFRDHVLFDQGEPHAELAVDPEGWLVASQGDYTLGFAHCTVGRFKHDARDVRRGFLRFLAIRPDAPAETAMALFTAIDSYFRSHKVNQVDAFDIRTGYPCCLAGRGALASDRLDLMAALGRAKYQMTDRWLLYEKRTYPQVIEHLPKLGGLLLQIEDRDDGGFTLYVSERITPVGRLTVLPLPATSEGTNIPTASLHHLVIEGQYQRQGVARWLGQRATNELYVRGVQRLVADVNHVNEAGQSLLLGLGFDELAVRGYSYEKSFTS